MSESEEPSPEGKTLRSGRFVAPAVRSKEREVTPLDMYEEDGEAKSVEEL